MNSIIKKKLLLIYLLFFCFSATAQTLSSPDTLATAESVVTEIYDLVTFKAGTTPNWDKVRSLFIKQAVIVLRTSRENTTIFSVDGFIQDFVNFIEQTQAKTNGFEEKIIKMKSMIFGEIAHILVLYQAHIPGSPKPPRQGVDSFQLIRKNGQWRIVSIINEIPTKDRPIPAEL